MSHLAPRPEQSTTAEATLLTALNNLAAGGAGTAIQKTTATTFSNVAAFPTTSAGLAAAITDETGSGSLVFATSPGFTTSINPISANSATIGTSSLGWSALYLGNGSVIDWNSGDVVLTHTANTLAFTGGQVTFDTDIRLIDGGTGASLADPDADRILFWDDSLGAVTWLTAGSGLTITGTTLTAATGGLTWSEVVGTSQTAAVNFAYITNNAGLVTVTIPDTAAVGDVIRIVGKGAGGWLLAQNASENINFGNTTSTTGVGGSLASTHRYDCVELVCTVANTTWTVLSSQGNITIV